MTFDAYEFWRFVHVLLFVYWLGGDLGVYLAAKYVARKDLGAEERRRFLDLTLFIDMGPRNALILLPAVGFQLSHMGGYLTLSESALGLVWIFTFAWLALLWVIFLRRHDEIGTLKTFDVGLRYAVLTAMALIGLSSLATGGPITDAWLSAKFILYGACIADGLYLRRIMAHWERGFVLIESGGSPLEGNRLIAKAAAKGQWFGLLMWALLIAVGYLGAMKPF